VHVVDDLHNSQSRIGEERREERNAVLAVEDGVELAAGAHQPARGSRVEGQLTARPEHVQSVDDLAARLAFGAGGEPGDVDSPLDPATADLVHVLLGATGLRVPGVAPVQDEDARSG
jgi:hypothetical protein